MFHFRFKSSPKQLSKDTKLMWTLFMCFTFVFRALLNSSARIPEPRREELSQVVKCHFNVDTLDDELLQEAIDIDIR